MSENHSVEFDGAISLEFLELLDPNDVLTRSECWFQLPERPGEFGLYAKNTHASFTDIHARLPELGEMGFAIMVCINAIEPRSEQRRSPRNVPYIADVRYVSQIKRVRAVWGDFDDPSKPLPQFPIEPSFMVQSSPGKWHVYWLTDLDDSLPVDEFDTVQKAIIDAYKLNGADKSMKSPNHVMRLPGSVHRKEEPRPVQLVGVTGKRYKADELRTAFKRPETALAAVQQVTREARERVAALQDIGEEIHRRYGPPRENDGAYLVDCPWGRNHTSPRNKTEAVYFPPSDKNDYRGGYSCMHDHCAEMHAWHFHDYIRTLIATGVK